MKRSLMQHPETDPVFVFQSKAHHDDYGKISGELFSVNRKRSRKAPGGLANPTEMPDICHPWAEHGFPMNFRHTDFI